MADTKPSSSISRPEPGLVRLHLKCDLTLDHPAPNLDALNQAPDIRRLVVNGADVGAWDTSLPLFLQRLAQAAEQRGLNLEHEELPAGALRLL